MLGHLLTLCAGIITEHAGHQNMLVYDCHITLV